MFYASLYICAPNQLVCLQNWCHATDFMAYNRIMQMNSSAQSNFLDVEVNFPNSTVLKHLSLELSSLVVSWSSTLTDLKEPNSAHVTSKGWRPFTRAALGPYPSEWLETLMTWNRSHNRVSSFLFICVTKTMVVKWFPTFHKKISLYLYSPRLAKIRSQII